MTVTVLVVDDTEDMRLLVRLSLMQTGYHVVEAANGEEALRLMDGRRLDAVICDYKMPYLDGIEFTKQARAHPAYAGLPILMLSATDDPEIIAHGMNAGATDWMTKPFSVNDLIERVQFHFAK